MTETAPDCGQTTILYTPITRAKKEGGRHIHSRFSLSTKPCTIPLDWHRITKVPLDVSPNASSRTTVGRGDISGLVACMGFEISLHSLSEVKEGA